jgi:hypothetical protein
MEIKFKIGAEGKTLSGVTAGLGAYIRRIVKVSLPTSMEGISVDMFASDWLPYQASKTYRTILAESDCRRAQTIIELQRSLRCV